jgi:LuxR family quorum-sensing system transcriptional regulator SolR
VPGLLDWPQHAQGVMMRNWQGELVEALQALPTEEAVFERLCAMAKEMGFDYCAFGLRTPLPISAPRTSMRTNYPLAWQHKYATEGYLAVDPNVSHGMRSVLPLVWTDKTFVNAPEFWEEARSHGIKVGWAQATRDPSGFMGLLALARSAEQLEEPELVDKEYRMVWLTQVAHQGMARFMSSNLMPEQEISLSPREITVLRWTAEGKTSGEISDILGISERTVNFHINNLMTKMNVTNKTAAAIRAAVMGLLY